MVRLPAPPGAARRGALRGGAMKPSIVCGPPAFDRFLTGLTRSKAAVGTMGRLRRNCVGGGGVQLRRVATAAAGVMRAAMVLPFRLASVLRPVRFPFAWRDRRCSLGGTIAGGRSLRGGNAGTGRPFSGGSNEAVAPSRPTIGGQRRGG